MIFYSFNYRNGNPKALQVSICGHFIQVHNFNFKKWISATTFVFTTLDIYYTQLLHQFKIPKNGILLDFIFHCTQNRLHSVSSGWYRLFLHKFFYETKYFSNYCEVLFQWETQVWTSNETGLISKVNVQTENNQLTVPNLSLISEVFSTFELISLESDFSNKNYVLYFHYLTMGQHMSLV